MPLPGDGAGPAAEEERRHGLDHPAAGENLAMLYGLLQGLRQGQRVETGQFASCHG